MKQVLFIALLLLVGLRATAQNELQLNEARVVASRTTNNAEGYTTNLRGSNITKERPTVEVLSFLPNISHEQGAFKINGLPVSEIYVDGIKLSDISELDNIPGEMIDKIQVKYLTGADKNASLSGGTIMITLRPPSEGGYYGSINTFANWYRSCGFGNEGIGGLINYRYKNLSVYDNLHLASSKFEENSEQRLIGPDLNTYISETTKSSGFDFRNRLSLTQQFKSGAKIGGSYLVALNRPRPSSISYDNDIVSSIDSKINTVVQEGTLRFSTPLNSKGVSMEVTADYFNRHNTQGSFYFYQKENVAKVDESNELSLWKFQSDFIYPLSQKTRLTFGASTQLISSSYTPTELLENDRYVTSSVPSKTNGFTPIVYTVVQGMMWKLRYSVGLNWQLNRIEYHDRSADIRSFNTQSSLNPTIQIMMPLGARREHSMMLNYKRTLNDIPYSAISSVVNWSDSYNYTVGNPDLKAQSADMVMAAVSLFHNKLNITTIYAHSHDRLYWQIFQDADNPEVFYTKPINIDGQAAWGFGAEWMESSVKWWQFKLSARVEVTPENLTLDGVHYGKTRFKEYFYFNNSFTFSNGWGGILNANFEPTFRTLDYTYHAVYNMSGRIYKTFLNNAFQVSLNFTALGNRRKLDRQVGEKLVSYRYTTPVQHVGLSLIWNFSGGRKVNVNVIDGIQGYYETKESR